MATQSAPPPRAVFGPFDLDYVSGDLKKAGRSIRLRGQPMQVLMALLETPGELVSRTQLQQRLWPGAEFGDFDQGLNAAVNKLRQALADSAENPRYIETIAGEGYRFLAPVHRRISTSLVEIPGPRPVTPVTDSNAEERTPYGRRRLLALAAVIVFTGIAYWVTRPVPLGPAMQAVVTPPEGFAMEPSALRQSFSLSPDGTKLAYTGMDASGAQHTFLRESDGSQHELAGTVGAYTMFWPPDGQSLVVAARGRILRVPLNGAGQLVLGDAPSSLLSGMFAKPGQLFLHTNRETYTLSSSGGEIAPAAGFYPWGQTLPGGKSILYTAIDRSKGTRRVVRIAPFGHPEAGHDIVPADSRAQYTESAKHPGSGYLLYVRAGSLIALPFDPGAGVPTGDAVAVAKNIYTFGPSGSADFSVSASGTLAYQNFTSRTQLAWVDRRGRELERVGPADVNVMSGRLSPDGKWIVATYYDLANGGQDLWLLETKTGARRRLAPTAELRDAPRWSADSKELFYLLAGTPVKVAFRGLSEGEPERPLLSPDGNAFPMDWSHDGRYVLMTNTGFPRFANEVQSDVWVIDLARDRKKTALLKTPYHETNATFSPDGKWVAFLSTESGEPQIYMQAFRGGDDPALEGPRLSVVQAGAQSLAWRADGRELYYMGFDSAVYALSVTGGKEPRFGVPERLFAINPAAGAAFHALVAFDVAPDGSRFLIPVVNTNRKEPSITIVQNWERLLDRN